MTSAIDQKLDEFLKISGRKLLDHAGKISHEAAVKKGRIGIQNSALWKSEAVARRKKILRHGEKS